MCLKLYPHTTAAVNLDKFLMMAGGFSHQVKSLSWLRCPAMELYYMAKCKERLNETFLESSMFFSCVCVFKVVDMFKTVQVFLFKNLNKCRKSIILHNYIKLILILPN
jgi:hypothetical protein